jgi:thymidine kinase
MSKLYFYYSSMNAGKTTALLQSSYNYQERGMNTLLFTAAIDDRFGVGKICSRIGLEASANIFREEDDLYQFTANAQRREKIDCVLVDEAQFLTQDQVFQLSEVVDRLDIPVLTFGLRTDFQGNLFEGSMALLAWADELKELKTVCHCGKKATMVVRLDENNKVVSDGKQVEIGGNDRYLSMCRKHFKELVIYPNHADNG